MTTGDKYIEPPSDPQPGESKAAATLGSRSEAGAGAIPIPVPGAGATPTPGQGYESGSCMVPTTACADQFGA